MVRKGDETGDVGDVVVGFGGERWEAVAAVGLVVLFGVGVSSWRRKGGAGCGLRTHWRIPVPLT